MCKQDKSWILSLLISLTLVAVFIVVSWSPVLANLPVSSPPGGAIHAQSSKPAFCVDPGRKTQSGAWEWI